MSTFAIFPFLQQSSNILNYKWSVLKIPWLAEGPIINSMRTRPHFVSIVYAGLSLLWPRLPLETYFCDSKKAFPFGPEWFLSWINTETTLVEALMRLTHGSATELAITFMCARGQALSWHYRLHLRIDWTPFVIQSLLKKLIRREPIWGTDPTTLRGSLL